MLLHFDEGSGEYVYDKTAYNNSGSFHGGNDGTLYNGSISCYDDGTLNNGCPKWVQGKFGKALSFDGVDDYVEVPDSSSLHITDEVTVLAWIKPAINREQYIETKHPYDGVYRLGLNPEGKIWVRLVREDGTVIVDNGYSNKVVELNKWNFVGFTYDGSKVIKYLNGENVYEITGLSGKLNTDPGDLYVGTFAPASYNFNGAIDEVIIYNRSLSEDEIKRTHLLSFLVRNPSSALIPNLQIAVKIKNKYTGKEEIYMNKTTGISLNLGEIKILQIRVPEGEVEKIIVSSPCGVSAEIEPVRKIECG